MRLEMVAFALAVHCLAAPVLARDTMTYLREVDFAGGHLRGFDFGDLEYGIPAESGFDLAKRTGANLLRVFFAIDRPAGGERYVLTESNMTILDRYLDEAEARGLWVIIACHPPFADKEEHGALWNSAALEDSYTAAVRQLAARYKDRPVVGGFDILNEPVPPGRTFAERQRRWLELAERIARAVQAVDARTPLIIQPAPDALSEAFDTLTPLPLPNIVYSVHSYLPMALTHQFVMKEYRDAMSYGAAGGRAEQWDKAKLMASLEPVRRFAARYHRPIYVGEFSCVRWAPEKSAVRYVADSVTLFTDAGWSWTYHDLQGWTGWDPEIDSPDREATRRSVDAPVFRTLAAAMSRSATAP